MVEKKEKKDLAGGEFAPAGFNDAVDIGLAVDNPFDLPLLDKFLDGKSEKPAVLTSWSIKESSFGAYAVLSIRGHGDFRCNSDAVVDQVRQLDLYADEHPEMRSKGVACFPSRRTSKNGQSYFSLIRPFGSDPAGGSS